MAKSPAALPKNVDAKRKGRVAAQVKYAVYPLADGLDVANAILQQGGGVASVDELAAFLGYKSTNNGAFYDKMSAARMYGLIQGQGAQIELTTRAQEIISPVYAEQVAKGKVEAWLSVPLFRAVYEEFQGRSLPPVAGLKNLLRTKYGVPPTRVDQAYRSLMESAEQAGFFATRGNRSAFILPRVRPGQESLKPADAPGEADDEAAAARHEPAGSSERQTASIDDLKNSYVATLIEMLAKKGEPDLELMAKIEGLLGITETRE